MGYHRTTAYCSSNKLLISPRIEIRVEALLQVSERRVEPVSSLSADRFTFFVSKKSRDTEMPWSLYPGNLFSAKFSPVAYLFPDQTALYANAAQGVVSPALAEPATRGVYGI